MQRGAIIGIVIAIIAVVIIVLLAVVLPNNQSSGNGVTPEDKTSTINLPSPTAGTGAQTHTVEITSSGFSPKTLEIKQGDTVVFLNKDTNPHWPASAMHPTHTVYPGSGISKCGTSEQSMIFDACEEINQGESFTFTFNEIGSWNYHDHLNPGAFFGTIKVK